MKYRLLKDIGFYNKGKIFNVKEGEELTLAIYTTEKDEVNQLAKLIEQGYIEEIQEPWATDKDCIEFYKYAKHEPTERLTTLLQQFKQERGK